MKVKVIRDYSGEEGEGPNKDVIAGRVLDVSEARAAELIAVKLAEPASGPADEAHPSLETDEQPVMPVEPFPSGGITSVAPLNATELEQENVMSQAPNSAHPAKDAAPPENKKARELANKAATKPANKTA